jgi:Beta-propeller repeat
MLCEYLIWHICLWKVGLAMLRFSVIKKQSPLLPLIVFGLFLASCSGELTANEINPLGLKGSYIRQFGTSYNDEPSGITTDVNGNVYIAVNTSSAIAKGYLHKYDSSGNFVETITPAGSPLGSYWHTYIKGITTDTNGNIYVTGNYTDYYKTYYVYVDKYDAMGRFVWTRNFRDTSVSYLGDPTHVYANAISTDARGNVYILVEKAPWPYQSRSTYVRKYSPRSGLLWEKAVGNVSSYTSRPTMTTDALGNIYTALASVNDTQQTNTRISKWDTQGNFLWSQSTNPSTTYFRTNVHGIVADTHGNVYVTGITDGSLEGPNQGSLDAFIRKYDGTGNVLWTKQFGTSSADWGNGISADVQGNIYVVGSTSGSLLVTNEGNYDGFVRKYDANGTALQARQFGTSDFDRATHVTLDANKNVYVAGATLGNLQGRNKGNLDAYIRKYAP